MRILLSVDCFYPAQMGGTSNTIYWLAKALRQAGHAVTVVATSQYLPSFVPINQWLTLDCGQVMYTRNSLFYLPVRHIWVGWRAMKNADVVHVNSFFYPASIAWVLMSRLMNKPVIWSPHGELSPAALRFRPFRKRLFLEIVRLLKLSVRFQATSHQEEMNIRQQFGPKARIEKIKSRMELPAFISLREVADPYLLFIGRLHPIKAIDRLILALSKSILFRESGYRLAIAGPVIDEIYFQTLAELVHKLNLSTKVSFIGPIQDEQKQLLYANAHITILPSHAENFGNVVIESLAQGTPVIASTNTPWQILETEQAGSWVHNDPDTLRQAIDMYLTMLPDDYHQYRMRAADLAQRAFSISEGIEEWEHLYELIV